MFVISRQVAYLGLIGIAGGLLVAAFFVDEQSIAAEGDLGQDYAFYRDVGQRWLADGSFYLPRQLAGPYDVALLVDTLYPPDALPLFVVAAVAPPVLWWAIPIGILVALIVSWQPSPVGVAAVLLLLAWPRAHSAFVYGNTDMWAAACVAGGLRWGWPAALLVLKPTLAPFALIGVRNRAWWAVIGMVVIAALFAIPLWLDYATAMQNVRRLGWDYSLGSIALLLVPLAAWIARRDDHHVPAANGRWLRSRAPVVRGS